MTRAKLFHVCTAMLLALVAFLGNSALAASDDPMNISGIRLDKHQRTLQLETDGPLGPNGHSAIKLVSPYRLVIDLPEAALTHPLADLKMDYPGIDKVTFNETRSTFYQAVRVTIYTHDYETLNRMAAVVEDGRLKIHLAGASLKDENTSQAQAPIGPAAPTSPVPGQGFSVWDTPDAYTPRHHVITDIYYKDRQLVVVGDNGQQKALKVKNRFTLTEPDRLVIDLDNAVVRSKALVGTILPHDDPATGEIRVGQFDEDTVRLVIETKQPERFQVYFPSVNRRHLVVSALPDISMITLPRSTQLGSLEGITLDQHDGATKLRLLTSAPAVYRTTKDRNRVVVELLNIAGRPGGVAFDQAKFPHIRGMQVQELSMGQPNSRFVLELDDPRYELETRLSRDQRHLELALVPAPSHLPLTKAPFPARIVVDAGHGGKDQGASRSGVLEKDLNLKAARRLKAELEARGFQVYMTRTDDRFLELSQITSITNRIRPDLFVSVHHNASTNSAISGIETYYYTSQSKPLAEKVHRKMVSNIATPDRGVRRAMFYVIHHTQVPAILCEMGYVSNSRELQSLTDEERQSLQVEALAEGVVDYLKSRMSARAR